jgi:hypothetical protein
MSVSAELNGSGAPFLVFLHIPKTGGKTVAAILHHLYGPAFRGGVGADDTTPAHRQMPNVFSRPEHVDERVRELAANPSVQAVAAHITFGLRDLLPAAARWLTVLRDPIERTLSQYYFLLPPVDDGRATGQGFVPPWLPVPSSKLTLEECLSARGYIPDNLQTRMLCGLVSPYDPLPPNALERAKRNLRDRFAFVGTTERLQEFLALLNVAFGWPTVAYKRSKSPVNPQGKDLPADVLRLIEERNALDRELYLCANALLEQALTDAGPELQVETAVFYRAAKLRKARQRGEGADPLTIVRSLPVSARAELALKEAELAEARLQIRRLKSRVKWRAGARRGDRVEGRAV